MSFLPWYLPNCICLCVSVSLAFLMILAHTFFSVLRDTSRITINLFGLESP